MGHVGSCLGIADILAALYGEALQIRDPADPDRDRFILSKAHAALALYAALHLRGWLSDAGLGSFCGDGSFLGVHPEHEVTGVDFSTGSLGMGLSMGAGAALAARMQGSPRRVFVLLSDAECDEGSVWEAAMFAAHHRLSNLVAIVDDNGQQALGLTEEVLSLRPLAEKWRAFGWSPYEVDGHDAPALASVIAGLPTASGASPSVLIAKTAFGHPVSFMRGRIEWHYLPMSDDDYRQALSEVDGAS